MSTGHLSLPLSLSRSLSLSLARYFSFCVFLSLARSLSLARHNTHTLSTGAPFVADFNDETLIIHKLGSRKPTAQDDLYYEYQSKRVVTLIESKSINHKCLQMNFSAHLSEGRVPTDSDAGVPRS